MEGYKWSYIKAFRNLFPYVRISVVCRRIPESVREDIRTGANLSDCRPLRRRLSCSQLVLIDEYLHTLAKKRKIVKTVDAEGVRG